MAHMFISTTIVGVSARVGHGGPICMRRVMFAMLGDMLASTWKIMILILTRVRVGADPHHRAVEPGGR
jgi:hypothetical protein